jgi:hypothetical protein
MVDFIGFFNGDFLVFFFAPNAQGNDLQPQHEKSPPGFAQQKWQQKRHQRNFGAWAKSPQDICFETGKSQQPHCEETHEHPIVISSWHVLKASQAAARREVPGSPTHSECPSPDRPLGLAQNYSQKTTLLQCWFNWECWSLYFKHGSSVIVLSIINLQVYNPVFYALNSIKYPSFMRKSSTIIKHIYFP